jgi:thiol-disulfide isomerase/thioredoxin
MYYIYIYIMDLQKYLNNMDHIDVILIIAVIVLLYIALSGNFEYYSSVDGSDENQYNGGHDYPFKHPGRDKVSRDVKPEHLVKPLHIDKTLHQEQGEVLPCSGGDEPPCEYDNPNDVDIAPVNYDTTIHDLTKKQPFNPIGIMDHTDNMGINIQDMDRPLASPGMDIYNASYGSVGRTPPQNIMNSMHEDQLQMDTLHLLRDSQNGTGGPLIDQDKNNGFFAHIGNELSHLENDVMGGLGLGNHMLVEGQLNIPPNGDSAKLSLVHADWCGYCQKAKPEFDKLKSDYHGKDINGVTIHMDDFEEKRDAHLIGEGKKFNVNGFPTFFFNQVKNGVEQQPIEFNAITYDTMLEKINELTGVGGANQGGANQGGAPQGGANPIPQGDHVQVNMIRADWCGFCKKAQPEFEKIMNDHHGNELDGHLMHMDHFEEKEHAHLIGKGKKFEVDGFPTFFVTQVKDGIEQSPLKFNASPTYEAILSKIKELLGQL